MRLTSDTGIPVRNARYGNWNSSMKYFSVCSCKYDQSLGRKSYQFHAERQRVADIAKQMRSKNCCKVIRNRNCNRYCAQGGKVCDEPISRETGTLTSGQHSQYPPLGVVHPSLCAKSGSAMFVHLVIDTYRLYQPVIELPLIESSPPYVLPFRRITRVRL
jgi:hypothetical protein